MQKNSITKKYQNLISQINNLEDRFQTLTDNDLRAESFKLKKHFHDCYFGISWSHFRSLTYNSASINTQWRKWP